MLRLFRQHGVCAANYRIAQQRIQFKRFFNGPEGESGVTQGLFESVDKQEGESSGKARLQVKQNWTPNDNDRLVSHSRSNRLTQTQLMISWVVGSCQQVS